MKLYWQRLNNNGIYQASFPGRWGKWWGCGHMVLGCSTLHHQPFSPRLYQNFRRQHVLLSALGVSAGYYKLNSPVNSFWGPLWIQFQTYFWSNCASEHTWLTCFQIRLAHVPLFSGLSYVTWNMSLLLNYHLDDKKGLPVFPPKATIVNVAYFYLFICGLTRFRPVRGLMWFPMEAGASCESNPHQLHYWNPGRLSPHHQIVLPATWRHMAVPLQC